MYARVYRTQTETLINQTFVDKTSSMSFNQSFPFPPFPPYFSASPRPDNLLPIYPRRSELRVKFVRDEAVLGNFHLAHASALPIGVILRSVNFRRITETEGI